MTAEARNRSRRHLRGAKDDGGRTLLLAIAVPVLTALAVGWPAVGESLWVDELHSAWCVADGVGEVASRAAIGNQTPFWFWLLWGWASVVGTSEPALRAASLIAWAATAGLIGWTGRRRYGVAAGLAAGLFVALERNAIFFGTELRVYSAVMLAAAIWWAGRRRYRWFDAVTIGAVGWLHPTAVVVPAVGWVASRRMGPVWAVAAMMASGLVLVGTVINPVWGDRGHWAAFAVPGSLADLIWVWPWWVLVPAGAAAILLPGKPQTHGGGLVIAVTLLFYVVASFGGVPVWHRRYMVGVLPVAAMVVGAGVGRVSRWDRRWGAAAAVAVAAALVGGQGGVTVSRGENWRGAARWIAGRVPSHQVVWVDAGLLEAAGEDLRIAGGGRMLSEPATQYFTYPMRGPYQVPNPVRPFSLGQSIGGKFPDSGVAVVRSSAGSIAAAFGGWEDRPEFSFVPLGGVCILVWGSSPSSPVWSTDRVTTVPSNAAAQHLVAGDSGLPRISPHQHLPKRDIADTL